MDSQDKLRELLNTANNPPKEFVAKNLLFGNPDNQGVEGYNTRIPAVGKPGKGYYGTVDVFYNRVDIGQVLAGLTVRYQGVPTPEEFLFQLSALQEIDLTIDDVLPFEIPEVTPGDTQLVSFSAVPDSFGWAGTATVGYEYGRPYLNVIINKTALDVLKHPTASDKLIADYVSFNLDFTSVREALVVTRGRVANWSVLQQVCRFNGIPEWPQSNVSDRATADVPGANPAFDRVVVHPRVSVAGMEGTFYFHYNLFDEA